MTIRRGAPCGRPSRAILASAFRHDCPEAVPPFPARDSETCYTPRSNLDTPRFDPNPLHAHKCPHTMPGPPTMSTCSKSNVQNPPKTQNAPGAAATSQKCADLPPTGPKMIPAIPPMPAPPTPGSISRNNKNAASPDSLHSAASAPSFSRSPAATVPKVSTSESRHELSSQYPVTRSSKNFFQTVSNCGQLRIRYPIDTRFPPFSSQFCPHLDTFWPIVGKTGRVFAHMRGFADKELDSATGYDPDCDKWRRRNHPQRATLLAQKAGRLHPRHRRGPGGRRPPSVQRTAALPARTCLRRHQCELQLRRVAGACGEAGTVF